MISITVLMRVQPCCCAAGEPDTLVQALAAAGRHTAAQQLGGAGRMCPGLPKTMHALPAEW